MIVSFSVCLSMSYVITIYIWNFWFLKQNKKERQKVREVGILKKDPEQIKEQIRKLDMSSKLCTSTFS